LHTVIVVVALLTYSYSRGRILAAGTVLARWRERRGRILIALRTAIALAGPTCADAWNEDPAARAYGGHNFSFHLYKGALVYCVTDDAAAVEPEEVGMCAVVFPSRALDPEPFAAGQVLRGAHRVPISTLPGVDLSRVAELQVTAGDSPNTTLGVHGELAAL
jgi:hypothetical protein